jgi:hypothetical protein
VILVERCHFDVHAFCHSRSPLISGAIPRLQHRCFWFTANLRPITLAQLSLLAASGNDFDGVKA